MGCREDAHVDGLLAGFADRAHRLLLHDAQQLDLHVQRQIGHLVEEQGAALGALHQALLVGHGAGEAAALVAEQLALHQLGGDRAAVDGDERALAARAALVYQPRHQLLAGAGFAVDVHRRLAACDACDHLPQLLHDVGVADELAAV